MSVIIKGMKMPKSCDSCDLIQFDDEGLEAHCPLSPYYRWCGTPPDYKPEGCLLVEVPTPHGRLIDADAVEKRLQKYWYEEYPNQEASYHRAFMDSNACVKDLPTIIEAEVSE